MVESISKIQQLLAESRFVEAQKEAELQIKQLKQEADADLLELLLQSLVAQSKQLPSEEVLSIAEKIQTTDPERASYWLEKLSSRREKLRINLLEINLAESKGRTEDLHRLLSSYLIACYEKALPMVPLQVKQLIQKYFKDDFKLQLELCALTLLRLDLETSEREIQQLIFSCFERSTVRGTQEKLSTLLDVLKGAENLYHLEVYKNFCQLMVNGISDKKDYKKIIEMIIYVDDFRMQVLVLHLLSLQHMDSVIEIYAPVIRSNKQYTYVYFDKYFQHLKPLFHKVSTKSSPVTTEVEKPDLSLGPVEKFQPVENLAAEISEEEVLLSHVLRLQNFTAAELFDIAVGFMQSELYHAALKANELAAAQTTEDTFLLKLHYLRVSCLLKLGDYRGAMDLSLEALKICSTQNDVLAFLYAQADAHLRLNEYKNAKTVLKRIISIDSGYRLAKERLEKLNAV